MTQLPTYPAMSHPSADPAVNAVAARLVGLKTADPAHARVLELGCGSGHHLLPLAARWPESGFLGIDHDADAIALARELAAEAGLANIEFRIGDLEADVGAGEACWDFIIAHGVFSWVPDFTKLCLLRWIHEGLAPNGIAVVSFNVAAGWKARVPLITKARLIQQAGDGVELMRALEILRDVCETDEERLIVDDMRAKGPAILAHDDFAPVCDAFSLPEFVTMAASFGLRWLGEGVPADNLPLHGAWVDPQAFPKDPVVVQDALDEAGGRTFRSALLCRAETSPEPRVSASVVADFFLSPGNIPDAQLLGILDGKPQMRGSECIARHGPAVASRIVNGIFAGSLNARTHAAAIASAVPDRPRLDELRLACARRGLPVVDAFHRPCAFPPAHADLLSMMDGTRGMEALTALASERCPDLDFLPWMRHLAGRGFFG